MEDRRNEISETFPGSGARFRNEMLASAQRLSNGIGHLQLLVADFVVLQPLGDASVSTKNLLDIKRFDLL